MLKGVEKQPHKNAKTIWRRVKNNFTVQKTTLTISETSHLSSLSDETVLYKNALY